MYIIYLLTVLAFTFRSECILDGVCSFALYASAADRTGLSSVSIDMGISLSKRDNTIVESLRCVLIHLKQFTEAMK